MKVELLMDSVYQVVEYEYGCRINNVTYDICLTEPNRVVLFQGTLTDCEAYIKFKKGGDL